MPGACEGMPRTDPTGERVVNAGPGSSSDAGPGPSSDVGAGGRPAAPCPSARRRVEAGHGGKLSCRAPGTGTMRGVTDDDPYLWLEDLESEAALAWVAERNAETRAALADGAGFASLKQSLREVLDASDRIPCTVRRGAYLYNFWQDAGHVRGVWRRTTLEQYRKDSPEWEVLLDVDALATSEDEKWVWAGARVRHPDHDRALVHLSRDGGDATVVREFDLAGRAFVQDGFQVEEAKTRVGWIDADTVFLGTDFGPGSMTGAGYPRTVRRWRRGTLPGEAEPVFEAETTDVSAWGAHDTTPGFERSFVGRAMGFYRDETYLLAPDGARIRIDVPDDASAYAHRRHLIVTLRSEWLGQPAGSLLAFGFDAFLAGDRTPEVLFTPDGRTALAGHSWTRHHLILETMHDVSTRIEVLTPGSDGGPWARRPLADVPALSDGSVVDTDPDVSDEYFLNVSGFLQPSTLYHGHIGGADTTDVLKQAPPRFDAAGLTVRQFFAASLDGTRVPYFVIGPDHSRTGPGPTLLHGYGGFEVSLTPFYDAVAGRAWLERGGTHVIANIRGGGEYGPQWHQAALRAGRPRAYEDFAAVAADLVTRGVTTPAMLGAEGAATAVSSWAPCSPATRSCSVRSSPMCRCWTCCVSTGSSPGRPGPPSTGTRTTPPICRTCGSSPRTTGSRRTGSILRSC